MDTVTPDSMKHSRGEDSADRRAERTHQRAKDTRASVLYGEQIAKWVISVGGLIVIFAVIGIMVFLFQVVAPLLEGGRVVSHDNHRLEARAAAWVNADEFQSLGIRVDARGRATVFHIRTGREISESALDFGGQTATAVGGTLERNQVAFGFENGTIRFGEVGFAVSSVARLNAPANMTRLDEFDFLAEDGSILSPVQTGDFRRIAPVLSIGEPQKISDSAIVVLDYRVGGTRERPTSSFVTVDAAGIARLSRTITQRNLMTGAETVRARSATLPGLPQDVKATSVLLATQGDRAIIATTDGMINRFDVRDPDKPILAERRRMFTQEGVSATSLAFLNGELALVAGGSDGSVNVYFNLQTPGAATADGFELRRARVHEPQKAAIVGIGISQRDKSLVTTDASGEVWLRHSTSDQVLFRFKRTGDASTGSMAMVYPRNDGVLKVDDQGVVDSWTVDFPHPEVSLNVLFGKVWYEGYQGPSFTWQSTAATDTFEPKYSLVPLIFGTIKATFYAMLFGVPLALMGAIYTSEFVHRSVRSTVKPAMEMMESLPTVVLGFIAALVLAPFVEEWIAAVLLVFISIPLGLLLGAHIWQCLPTGVTLRLEGLPKFAFMIVTILATGYIGFQLGPLFESLLFAGDFKAWTNGDFGSGTPFMTLLLWPLSGALVSFFVQKHLGHHWREMLRDVDRETAARWTFVRFGALLFVSLFASWLFSSLLTLVGFDPRGGIVDTYAQRNALVVGFVMGFAVIPNVYTLAEDALNSVPPHLRAGSLACGATPWQTAIWVVLPTAMSGVFSAVMIGMGRAVGETMIVVMAAGNTPIMEWNIFSGLRTLSANIAIELPEAVKDGTNYRVLFLAALTLFIMTFVINTFAELVRQRFRKRAFQL